MTALIAGGAAACTKPAETGSQACDLKIGFFGALSGENAGLVTPMKNGAALALDKYNAAHADCKVTLVDYDSQGDPAKAPALAQGAVSDAKVVAILGPAFSGESEAADPIFEAATLPTITPRQPVRAWTPRAGRSSTAASATTSCRARPAVFTSRTT